MAKKKKKDEAAEGEAGADAPEKAKSGKGKTMLLSALLVVGGALGQKFLLSSPPAQVIIAPPVEGGVDTASGGHEVDCSTVNTAEAASAEPHARLRSEGAATTGGSADLSSMTINLADGHYLKIGITLELGDTIVAEEFTKETAKAADVVLNYFATKSMDQLTNDKHASIKLELTCLIDAAYAEDHASGDGGSSSEPVQTVVGVLFREFLTS